MTLLKNNIPKYFEQLKKEGCKLCPLNSIYPLVGYRGSPTSRIMIIGENPVDKELIEGFPFIGTSGKLFERQFQETSLDKFNPYITNVGLCGTPKNRKLTKKEVKACSVHLEFQFRQILPEFCIAVGKHAMNWLVPESFDKKGKDLIFNPMLNIYGTITYYVWHPSYLLRKGALNISNLNYKENIQIFKEIVKLLNLS